MDVHVICMQGETCVCVFSGLPSNKEKTLSLIHICSHINISPYVFFHLLPTCFPYEFPPNGEVQSELCIWFHLAHTAFLFLLFIFLNPSRDLVVTLVNRLR